MTNGTLTPSEAPRITCAFRRECLEPKDLKVRFKNDNAPDDEVYVEQDTFFGWFANRCPGTLPGLLPVKGPNNAQWEFHLQRFDEETNWCKGTVLLVKLLGNGDDPSCEACSVAA
jgi:hypothetical protein